MAAPKGNQLAKKLPTPELRAEAFKSYCEHIASGYPKGCWYFKHPHLMLTDETMEKYIRDYSDEFDTILKDIAHKESYKLWFERGRKLTDGEVKGNPSPQTYALIMRNMFKWDRDHDTGSQGLHHLEKMLGNIAKGREEPKDPQS